MAFLTTLSNRAQTPQQILKDWDRFLADRQAEREAATAGTQVRSVTFNRDVRASQKRIESAIIAGLVPDEADINFREPNYPAMVAQYALEAVREHKYAIQQRIGAPEQHADCIAAWQMVARVGRTAQGDRETLGKLVAQAERRSLALVQSLRTARRVNRRAAQ